jgi:hypothetical protein
MPYKDPQKRKEAARIRMQRFRERHKEDPKYKENKKEWNKTTWRRHGKRYGEKYKQWYKENREERLLKMKQYREENKEALNKYKNEYNKLRRKTNTNFLIKSRLRCLIYNSVKLYGQGKKVEKSKTYGLNLNEIAEHLSNTKPLDFDEQLYHIDHIIPLASFNLSKSSEVKKAFNKNNLQWLPAIENIKKSNNHPTI